MARPLKVNVRALLLPQEMDRLPPAVSIQVSSSHRSWLCGPCRWPQVSCPQSCWCSLGMVLLGKSQPPILPQPLCPFSASAAKPGERGEAFSLHCFGEEQHALDYPSAVVPPSASQLSLHTPVRAAWAVTPSWCSSLSGVLLAAARTVKHQTAECNLLRSHEDPDLMVQV